MSVVLVYRLSKSLASKWSLIKDDKSKFIGVHVQVVKINKNGTSVADTLRRTYEFHKIKYPKDLGFFYAHCWLFLKDFPKWAES